MYEVDVRIEGVVPVLQHRFAPETLDSLMKGAKKKTAVVDYSDEWRIGMHVDSDGYLCQPATHIEGALVKAAASFKIKGGGNRTYKSIVRANCWVLPELIPHLHNGKRISAPGPDLLDNPTDHMWVDRRRAVVGRASVARARLAIGAGWELAFTLQVQDEQLRPDVVHTILEEAGKSAGIGDFRPRYGRFIVTVFELIGEQVLESAA